MKGRGVSREPGFSLIELAIVLLVIGLLLSGVLLPLTASIERARDGEARNALLQTVRPALLGYAASRPAASVYLPCPDCRASCGGPLPNDGIEDRLGSACAVNQGNLPWVTLGVSGIDPWGSRYAYAVLAGFADSTGFGLTTPNLAATAADLNVRSSQGGGFLVGGVAASAEGAVAIAWSAGKNRYAALSAQGVIQPPPPAPNNDESENADNDNEFVSRPRAAPANVQEFDDVLIWLSGHELRGFLVNAGRLP